MAITTAKPFIKTPIDVPSTKSYSALEEEIFYLKDELHRQRLHYKDLEEYYKKEVEFRRKLEGEVAVLRTRALDFSSLKTTVNTLLKQLNIKDKIEVKNEADLRRLFDIIWKNHKVNEPDVLAE